MVGASRFFFLLSTPFPLPLLHHRSHSLLQITRRHGHNLRKLLPQQLTAISLSSSSNFNHHYCLCISTPSSSVSPIGASQQFHSQTSSVSDDLGIEGSAFDNHSPSSSPLLWPEWSTFAENLSASGYFHRASNGSVDDELLASELQNEFVRSAYACLAFARERPNLLRLLRKRDIEVLVESGKPLLFKNADSSMRKMQLFINSGGTNDLDADKAQTIDLMRYILSYVSGTNKSSENNLYKGEIVESSARKLLVELSKLGFSAPDSNLIGSVNHFPYRYGQTASPLGQKVEMKRGDWICTRCSFMNFARNVKCLECEEARPKRQLTGGEWECPQCDFYNYGRNMVCLRCDCKRPGEISADRNQTISGIGVGGNGNNANVDERLAANEEKAQRWFSKISQMDSSSDMNKAMADKDFPEIMPLRKGVNRFVVSTKKTPLEKRSANPEFRQNLGNNGFSENNNDQPDGTSNSLDTTVSVKLDEILGRSRSLPNIGRNSSYSVSQEQSKGTNSNYVPFVPLPPDMFAKKPNSSTAEIELSARGHPQADKSTETESFTPQENSRSQGESINKATEEDEKSERWFKRVAELHNETDLANAISDDDFPEIMPMLKGENRFVVSKKKDRSLTSPAYKRRAAMEQAGNTSTFVPFVPFPPDYFAKKDKPSQEISTSDEPEKTQDQAINVVENVQPIDNQKNGSQNEVGQTLLNPQFRREDVSKNKVQQEENQRLSFSGSKSPPSGVPEIRDQWSGKSLEGSAVKEPDPLDMSEEAKAERWFRRVAQIKDISELSQIPDEDFPSIMPMRKGVNRFVVSKRKTPLERRLTSPQYRRNLPVVSSNPLKRENEES